MPNPPPRNRFQIHLSTAIVMMFVAGALIWANLSGFIVVKDPATFESRMGWVFGKNFGWPFAALTSVSSYFSVLTLKDVTRIQFVDRASGLLRM